MKEPRKLTTYGYNTFGCYYLCSTSKLQMHQSYCNLYLHTYIIFWNLNSRQTVKMLNMFFATWWEGKSNLIKQLAGFKKSCPGPDFQLDKTWNCSPNGPWRHIINLIGAGLQAAPTFLGPADYFTYSVSHLVSLQLKKCSCFVDRYCKVWYCIRTKTKQNNKKQTKLSDFSSLVSFSFWRDTVLHRTCWPAGFGD